MKPSRSEPILFVVWNRELTNRDFPPGNHYSRVDLPASVFLKYVHDFATPAAGPAGLVAVIGDEAPAEVIEAIGAQVPVKQFGCGRKLEGSAAAPESGNAEPLLLVASIQPGDNLAFLYPAKTWVPANGLTDRSMRVECWFVNSDQSLLRALHEFGQMVN